MTPTVFFIILGISLFITFMIFAFLFTYDCGFYKGQALEKQRLINHALKHRMVEYVVERYTGDTYLVWHNGVKFDADNEKYETYNDDEIIIP